ncbi:PAS domain S-box protein [Chloroflexia bacterium SDU3-3]|nr:PAS domain S-box protein [Chloroflexia bacterium SDU3-3]
MQHIETTVEPDLQPFRDFFKESFPTIVTNLVPDFRAISIAFHNAPEPIARERIQMHMVAFERGFDSSALIPPHVESSLGMIIRQQTKVANLLNLLSLFRQQFMDMAIRADMAGVPNTLWGLKRLMELADIASEHIVELHQLHLEEDIHRKTDELRNTRDRFEQAFMSTPLAMIEWDAQGRILFWNQSAQRIFGWAADEALGQNLIALLVPDVAADQVGGVLREVLSGQALNNRNQNTRRDGRLITCQWHNAVLRDEQGQVIGAISQAEDVTDQIRAEEERASLQQQIIEAQAAALHELSTPLIPLADGVVAMPLIGSIDSARAQQVIDTLLSGVAEHRARITILDITGVPVVDTKVANALLSAAQAVRLLGGEVVLTGIRPEVAQTLVGLGVDLGSIITLASLQSGIAYAFHSRAGKARR